MGRLIIKPKVSLKERVSGPNAVPITQLVRMGDEASKQVKGAFGAFLRERVNNLMALLPLMTSSNYGNDAWSAFFTVVRDLRGSSALAGNAAVNAFCKSFEALLLERDASDPRMREAILAHINALVLNVGEMRDPESQKMLALQLSSAVAALKDKNERR